MELLPSMDLGRSVYLSGFWVYPQVISQVVVNSSSQMQWAEPEVWPWGYKLASWLEPDNLQLLFWPLMHVLVFFSGKENVPDTVLFPQRFLWFNLVKWNQSCEVGKMKSKLLKSRLPCKHKGFCLSLTLYQKWHIEGDRFTHHFERVPVVFLRWRLCAALGQWKSECGSFYVRQFFGSAGSDVVTHLKGKLCPLNWKK